jgi:TRAP-type C4-dicarboxylate transport system permease small subunit
VRLPLVINEWLARIEGILLSIFLMGMVFLAFLQVVMRNVFNAGLPWADSVVRLLVIWVGFLGAALATKLDQNLSIDVLTKFLPERFRHVTSLVVKLFACVICLFLFRASLSFLADERSTGEQFIHLFPSWWTLTIIPATFILIPFHFVMTMIQDVYYLVKGKPT